MSTELSIIEDITPDRAPAIYGHGSLGKFYDHVKTEVTGEVPDLETKKGRDRIASLAAKVSKSKVAVEKPGRDYLKRIKELPKTIEAELREFTRQMDDLRDETRKPLTDWENAEKARVQAHEESIARLDRLSQTHHEEGAYSSATLQDQLSLVEAVSLGDHWEEFEAQAARAKDAAINKLKVAIFEQQQQEAEAVKAEQLRVEAEEKARLDREDQIRKEAAEAERVKVEQEAQRKEQEHQAAIDRANRERAEAEAKAAKEKLDADERQRKAVEAERQRIEAERVKVEQEAQRIASNKAHRASVNREALADLVRFGLNDEEGKRLITAIVKGEITNVSIKY